MTHCPRCGKDNPAEIHTCTPRALVLADALDNPTIQAGAIRHEIAAELRRLHAENEAAHTVGILQEKELMRLEAENEALRRMSFDSKYDEVRAENEALRDALKDATTSLETISRLAGKYAYLGDNGERIPTYMEHHDEVRGYAKSRASVARAALARAGEKT